MLVKFVLLSVCLSLINAKTFILRDSHHEAFDKKEMQYEEFPEVLKNLIQAAENRLKEEERDSKVGADLPVQSEQQNVSEDKEDDEEFAKEPEDEIEEEDLISMINKIPKPSSSELFKFITAQFNLLKEAWQNPTKHANKIANLVDWRKLVKNFVPSLEEFLADKNFENFAENLSDNMLKQKIDDLENEVNAENELAETGKQNLDIHIDLDKPAVREFISKAISKISVHFPFQDTLQGFMDMWKNKANQDFKVPIQEEPEVNFAELDK